MSSNVRSYINLIRQEFKQKNSKPLLCIRAPVFHSFWICIGLHPKIFPSLGPLEMLRFLWAPSVAARPLSVRYEWLILNVPEIYSFNIYIYIYYHIFTYYIHVSTSMKKGMNTREECTTLPCTMETWYADVGRFVQCDDAQVRQV